MPELEDIEAQRELLRLYRRNLALYLHQQAQQGGSAYVAPAVANGIIEAREQIAQIKAVLRGWSQAVDEHLNDAPTPSISTLDEPSRMATQAAPMEAAPAVSAPSAIDPDGLEAYFTDVEHLREAFRQLVSAPTLPKRIFVIHGVGGAGKSSLLRMFRIHARRTGVPTGLASGDEVKSVVDILAGWSDDLQAAGVPLPTTSRTLARYRGVQTAVEHQSQKAAGVAGKLAIKTAEGVAGSVAGAAIGSVFPVIGTVAGAAVGALVGTGGEALSDWLGTFLKRPDIDLVLDPTRQLTDAFLADIDKAAARQRLLLILDTFEQLSALDDWARGFAQRLHRNVLLVIGGRAVPGWGRAWSGWLAQARVEELKPMTPEIMRELIGRYYATMHGGEPDPKQVEAIISFARGLPVVVTSAVQLWVAYGVEDFQSVKPQVVADLVDRLLEGVPRDLVPMLEAAAALRWFNKDLLRAVVQQEEVDAAYDELRRFPFIRPRVEGLAFHDAVREMMDENLQAHDPERHKELHKRASTYFENQLVNASKINKELFGLERLYHTIRMDESAGLTLFQETAETLASYRSIESLRRWLSEVVEDTFKEMNSKLWCKYYQARLAHIEQQIDGAEAAYQQIADDSRAEPKLVAYALCDLGEILAQYQRLTQPGSIEKATRILEQSIRIAPLDTHLCEGLFHLGRIARYKKDWTKQVWYLEQAKAFLEQTAGSYGVVRTAIEIKRVHGRRGFWKDFISIHKQADQILASIQPEPLLLKAALCGGWAYVWALMGRFAECEQIARTALHIFEDQKSDPSMVILHDLGWALGVQGRVAEADICFSQSIQIADALSKSQQRNRAIALGFWGATLLFCRQLDRAQELLMQSLEMRLALSDHDGSQEPLTWLGQLMELKGQSDEAAEYYVRAQATRTGRYYFECAALAGLVRVKHAQGDYDAIPPLLAEAEALAQQYEYNDHLASLRLSQAQMAWDGALPALGRGFDAALGYFKQALIYALRYNRFLLDEVLWGGGVCTPLKPIIPHCLERTFEGQRMLGALRYWWQTGVNDIGVARSDTISPIPEGISLLEAERIAREREPGDGTPQRTVLDAL